MKRVVVFALPVLLLVSACSAVGEEPPAEPSGSPVEAVEETVGIPVRLVTGSGNVAANHDDEYCAWVGPSYVLRDAEGVIVAEGEAESRIEGEAEAGGEAAQIGSVQTVEPYECVLDFRIEEAPESEFYELEVSTEALLEEGDLTVGDTLSLEDARSGKVELEFSG